MDKEVLDFRVVLFKRDINNRKEELNTHPNKYSFNLEEIEKERIELRKEIGIDQILLDNLLKDLKDQVVR
jgi:hypothetical protein